MSSSEVKPVGPGGEGTPVVLQPDKAPRSTYSLAIGYLRGSIVALVVVGHSIIAYCLLVPPIQTSLHAAPRAWALYPVIDRQRWLGASLYAGFADTCLISLFFFISGLFVWKSLERRGSAVFLRERLLRLGLPFIAAALLAPLAYYPAYLQTGANPSPAAFAREWLSLGTWWVGPAWFIWVLLVFDGLAALCFHFLPRSLKDAARLGGRTLPSLVASFSLLVGVTSLAYIPLLHLVGPLTWSGVGPFFFQTSRPLHYAVYFTAGIIVGAGGIERDWLSPDGALARRWWVWAVAGLITYWLFIVSVVLALTNHMSLAQWETAGGFAFVLCCGALGFASLAFSLRFVKARRAWLDSLSRNAYGIFLIHIVFVTWLQYALLQAPLHAALKFSLVFLGALALSWGATAALRRLPAVDRVI